MGHLLLYLITLKMKLILNSNKNSTSNSNHRKLRKRDRKLVLHYYLKIRHNNRNIPCHFFYSRVDLLPMDMHNCTTNWNWSEDTIGYPLGTTTILSNLHFVQKMRRIELIESVASTVLGWDFSGLCASKNLLTTTEWFTKVQWGKNVK